MIEQIQLNYLIYYYNNGQYQLESDIDLNDDEINFLQDFINKINLASLELVDEKMDYAKYNNAFVFAVFESKILVFKTVAGSYGLGIDKEIEGLVFEIKHKRLLWSYLDYIAALLYSDEFYDSQRSKFISIDVIESIIPSEVCDMSILNAVKNEKKGKVVRSFCVSSLNEVKDGMVCYTNELKDKRKSHHSIIDTICNLNDEDVSVSYEGGVVSYEEPSLKHIKKEKGIFQEYKRINLERKNGKVYWIFMKDKVEKRIKSFEDNNNVSLEELEELLK